MENVFTLIKPGKFILFFTLFLVGNTLFAQEKLKTFYTWNGEEIRESNQSAADFYMQIPSSADALVTGIVKAYYPDGISYGYFSLKEGHANGHFEILFRNGTKKMKGQMLNGKPIGKRVEWYANGQVSTQLQYDMTDNTTQTRMIAHWDSLGNQKIKGGNGMLTEYHPDGRLAQQGLYKAGLKSGTWKGSSKNGSMTYTEEYSDNGELQNGISYDENGSSYRYEQVLVQASFPGGNPAWVNYLSKNLRYPKKASRLGVEGDVFMFFLLDQGGNTSEVSVLEGIGAGCDKEATRVLRQSPKWTPAVLRGQKVKAKMLIKIRFRFN